MARTLTGKEIVMGQLALAAYQGVLTYQPDEIPDDPTEGSIQKTLHEDLKKHLDDQLNLGDYEIMWGPAVAFQPAIPAALLPLFWPFLISKKAPIAYMFIAKKRGEAEFTVVIRGTNPVSLYSWLIQDLAVATQVEWNSVLGTGAPPVDEACKVSQSAKAALDIHTGLQAWSWYYGDDRKTVFNHNYNFVDYLSENVVNYKSEYRLPEGQKIKLNFCGHSLGGMLAPLLAQWFRDAHGDVADEFDISVYALACPTAGNQAYAQRVEDTFYNALNVYLNDSDGAGHAWNDMTGYINQLFDKADTNCGEMKQASLQDTPQADDELKRTAADLVKTDTYADTLQTMYAQLAPVTDIPELPLKYKLQPSDDKVVAIFNKINWATRYLAFQHIVPYGVAFQSDGCPPSALLSPFMGIDFLKEEIDNLD